MSGAQKLDYSNTKLDADQFIEIFKTKMSPGTYSVISFRNTGMTDQVAEELACVFTRGEWEIELLDLSCNSMFHAGITSLSRCCKVPSRCSIVQLQLSNNHMGDQGAESLAMAIKENRCLKSIQLVQNAITDTGAEVLAEALTFNNKITDFAIAGNLITDVGGIILANMLGGLGINPYGEPWEEPEPEEDEAAKKAGAKVAKKEKKTEEELVKEAEEAKAKTEALEAATRKQRVALKKNVTIVYMDIEDNQIDIKGLDALSKGTLGHSELLTLKIGGNSGSTTSVTTSRAKERAMATNAVEEAIKHNNNLRVGIVKTAFLLGFHPRVGFRSTIRSVLLSPDAVSLFPAKQGEAKSEESKEASESSKSTTSKYSFDITVFDHVWEYLGPV